MCEFFSFIGDGYGNFKFFDWAQRTTLNGIESFDSHTSIATYYGIPADKQDRWSKYEYNPLTKNFNVDESVMGHDHAAACKWVESRGWETIIEPLIIKPIINPLNKKRRILAPTIVELVALQKWDRVRDSVRDSVGASVWDRVRDSVGASVGAYIGSFFAIDYKVDIASSNLLWSHGLFPSFDGKLWCLHAGKKAKIVWQGTRKDLDKAIKEAAK